MAWCWPASRVHRRGLPPQILMLHCHSPAFNLGSERGDGFFGQRHKSNVMKRKIEFYTGLLVFLIFSPPSHFTAEYGDFREKILLQTLKKNPSIDNEKLDPFSCQPVLSIVFYLCQDILQLKIVRSLYLVFSYWQDEFESKKSFPMAISCGYNRWWHILKLLSLKTHWLTPVWVG